MDITEEVLKFAGMDQGSTPGASTETPQENGEESAGAHRVPRRCRNCSAELAPPRHVYCARACKDAWRSRTRHPRVEAPCAFCGKSFLAAKARLDEGLPVWCSSRCVGDRMIATGAQAGANNPRWLGGVSNDNMRYKRRADERHPDRTEARVLVRNAVSRGDLKRRPCEVCSDPKAQAHHDDYSKPLDVRWLCRTHHDEHHAPERAAAVAARVAAATHAAKKSAGKRLSKVPTRRGRGFMWRGKWRAA